MLITSSVSSLIWAVLFLYQHRTLTGPNPFKKPTEKNSMTAYVNDLLILRWGKATDLKASSFEFIFNMYSFLHTYIYIYLDFCVWGLSFCLRKQRFRKEQSSGKTMRYPVAVNMHLFAKAIEFRKAFLSRWRCSFWKPPHHCNAFFKSNVFEDPLSWNEHNNWIVDSLKKSFQKINGEYKVF